MKYALIIGNNKYNDPKLAQLKTPEADARALAKVLGTEKIGNFDEVSPLINQTESKSRRAISEFLSNKKPDDLVLVYFSGHGVLDDRGGLFLALKDTQTRSLNATAISSSFITYEMDTCRSRQQILILDCCHSGAFARGTKGPQRAVTESTFEGSGSGRVVLTASDSTQVAFEGDQVISQTNLSLFTHFLLEGLKTGEADTNNDGNVSLDEWYDYCHAKITATTPKQVPHKWSYRQQGGLIIAQNPFAKKKQKLERQPKHIQLRIMLDHKQQEYRQHKLLLDSKELAIIATGLEGTKLELQEGDKRLILFSAVTNRQGQKWLAICGKNGLKWLHEAYLDRSCPQEVRLGAARCLGEVEDRQTYDDLLSGIEQNSQQAGRSFWLDLLTQYLYGSTRRYQLPFSVRKDVYSRLIKITVQEGAEERAQISVRSAIIGFICSFIAYYISRPDQTIVTFILIAFLYSAIGAVLAIVFAQALTLTAHITRKWLLPWQLLALAGVGSTMGAGVIIFITAHVQVWFIGGLFGLAQAVLSRVEKRTYSIVLTILVVAFTFSYAAIALSDQQSSWGYALSASLFSGIYLYSIYCRFNSQVQLEGRLER